MEDYKGMNYDFHPEALEEYLDSVSYYADINQLLAVSFIKEIEKGIKNILLYPEAWQHIEDGIRRYLIKRFPFGIYYCIENHKIQIYAIMHLKRHPDYWKSRLKS